MFKKLFSIVIVITFTVQSFSQVVDASPAASNVPTSNWTNGGSIGLNLSQASFSNWASGGINSLAINGLLSLFAGYKNNGHTWDNTLDLGYGVMKQGTGAPIKTDDKIDLSSKYGKQSANKNWFYSGLFNFKTQMVEGYNYPNTTNPISNFLAPAYLVMALGMDYKPNEIFSMFIAPATYRGTYVNDTALANSGAFGVTKATYDASNKLTQAGSMARHELGGFVRIVYKNSFFENKAVSITSKLDLFSNYLDKPTNIVINWENIIGFKVTKYIAASIVLHFIYDDNIKTTKADGTKGGPSLQTKEVIAIGFSHKF